MSIRECLVLALISVASTLTAAEMKVTRDVPYVTPASPRRLLDVYAPAEGKDRPVVVWIHGGGWRQGDKAAVQQKPQAFVDRGFVFVSINYRFVPQVTIKEMTGDVAKAIRWVHDHAGEHGGDGKRLFVMGHSAGAHLAALVCTDDRYLQAEGLPLSIVKGCVPVDTAAYDVPRRFAESPAGKGEAGRAIFGSDEAMHRELSPITYAGKVKQIPPFLILHVADRPDSTAQSIAFAAALKKADVEATLVPGEGKTHGTINSELGRSDDKPTQALFDFMDKQLK
jgi:arylformamidase